MGENGKDKKVKLEDFSVVELLEKLENEQDDDKWLEYWAELLKRPPFDQFEDFVTRMEKLEERLDKLMKIFKSHEHLHGSVMVKL